MEDKIKLFLQYIEKEKELVLEWDKEEGVDVEAEDYKMSLVNVDRIKAFIAYRNIRVEEAWHARLNRGNNSREVREKACEYDAKRSNKHSLALNAMININKFGERYGLPKFYDGELLEPKDIDNYKNIDIRKKETDFFLQFIDSLSRVPSITMQKYFDELGIEGEAKVEKGFLSELQSGVETIDRKYGVEKNLTTDDGDITFKADEEYSRF